jgi:hypothetical protein
MLLVEFTPIALFILNRKKKSFINPIFLFVFFSFSFEVLSKISAIFFGTNLLVFNLYGLFEFFALIAFFYSIDYDKKILVLCFFLFLIVYILQFKTNKTMDISYVLGSIIWIFLSITSLINIIKYGNEEMGTKFYFICSILFYNATTIVLFSIIYLLVKSENSLWIIHSFLKTISITITSYAIWKLPSKSI